MPSKDSRGDESLPVEITRAIDAVCDEFEQRLSQGAGLFFGDYVDRVEPAYRKALLHELAELAIYNAKQRGAGDPWPAVIAANPSRKSELEELKRLRTETQSLRSCPE